MAPQPSLSLSASPSSERMGLLHWGVVSELLRLGLKSSSIVSGPCLFHLPRLPSPYLLISYKAAPRAGFFQVPFPVSCLTYPLGSWVSSFGLFSVLVEKWKRIRWSWDPVFVFIYVWNEFFTAWSIKFKGETVLGGAETLYFSMVYLYCQ